MSGAGGGESSGWLWSGAIDQSTLLGPINPETARAGVFLVWGNSRQTQSYVTYPLGYVQPINTVAWDAATNTLYAKPDEQLDHDRDYGLVITDAVTAPNGQRVQVAENLPAVASELAALFRPATIVAYTTFHTQNVLRSITAVNLGPTRTVERTLSRVIDLTQVRSLALFSQVSTNPAVPLVATPLPVDVAFLQTLGLRRLAFLKFKNSQGVEVHFHAWIPATPAPASGYPVTFIGHGSGDSRLFGPTLLASSVAANSVVLAMDAVGHGLGANSVLRFTFLDGSTVEAPLPGRGVDVDRDGLLTPGEGCIVPSPGQPAGGRDCLRQTALDWQKLAREVAAGMDLDGDGRPDLDPLRISYLGQSLGSFYGTILTGIEPSIRTAVMNVGGGSLLETVRYQQGLTPLRGYVAQVYPELYPDPTKPLPDPLTPRWSAAQRLTDRQGQYLEFLDRVAALEADSAPASYAPLLKQATLYGNPIKRVLFQFAIGDQVVSNAANFQLMRAAFEYENVSLYRHDVARRLFPALPADPHTFLAAFTEFTNQNALLIGLGALNQAGVFLATGQVTYPLELFQKLGQDPTLVFP